MSFVRLMRFQFHSAVGFHFLDDANAFRVILVFGFSIRGSLLDFYAVLELARLDLHSFVNGDNFVVLGRNIGNELRLKFIPHLGFRRDKDTGSLRVLAQQPTRRSGR